MTFIKQLASFLRQRTHVVALAAIVLAIQFFPDHPPAGIYGLGVVSGAALALHALGLVLIFRSNRIINFAQVQVGITCGVLFASLIHLGPLLRLVEAVCPGCTAASGWIDVNYWLSIAIALLFAGLLGYSVYFFVIRKFANAPRLILTVATIFVAQLLAGLAGVIPRLLASEEQRDFGLELGASSPSFDFVVSVDSVRFHAPAVLTLIVAAIGATALAIYLKRSSTGIAIRSSSDNPDRASTLGINVSAVSGRVWLLASLLSGAAGILGAMAVSPVGQTPLQVAGTVRILAVAVIAGLQSLPIVLGASIVFGMLDQAVLWSFGSLVVLDGILLFLVGGVLLLQRYKQVRATSAVVTGWRATREARPIPPPLMALPEVQMWRRIGLVALSIVLFGIPWILSPRQTGTVSAALIFAIVGLSLLVLTGWAGQISLGQFGFAAIGGWVVAMLPLPFPLDLLLGAVAGSLVAIIVGIPALKMRGLHLAITSLAFSLTATTLLLNHDYLGRGLPQTIDRPALVGMDLDDERSFYYATLFVLIVVAVAVAGMRRSRTGRALIAARDNEPGAQTFGISPVRIRLVAFAASGFIAALAGGLFALNQHGVKTAAFAPEASVTVFLMTVIGGLGSIVGPLVGALYLGVLELFATNSTVQFVATGGGGLFLLLIVPGGLAKMIFEIRDALLRRFARRHRIVVPSLMGEGGWTQGIIPIEPKRDGAAAAYVEEKYRLRDQWALAAVGAEAAESETDRGN